MYFELMKLILCNPPTSMNLVLTKPQALVIVTFTTAFDTCITPPVPVFLNPTTVAKTFIQKRIIYSTYYSAFSYATVISCSMILISLLYVFRDFMQSFIKLCDPFLYRYDSLVYCKPQITDNLY